MAKAKIYLSKRNEACWIVKAPMILKNRFDQITRQRIINGKDKRTVPYSRLLLAVSRHDKLMEDLIRADLIEDDNK